MNASSKAPLLCGPSFVAAVGAQANPNAGALLPLKPREG
jgi:hypothetical protein